MSRPLFASGGLALLALGLGAGAFADDDTKSKSEAAIKAKNEAILRKLEKPIPLRVKNVPLEEVLGYVQKATRKGPDDKGIAIYVDPVGLLEAEKSLATPISFVAKGEPLKSSLGRLLKSIGLVYVVKDGLLTITSASDEPMPARDAQDKREMPW